MSEINSVAAVQANPTSSESIESNETDDFSGASSEVAGEIGKEDLSNAEKKQIAKLKKLKLKFNGREVEEELPFEIDDTPEARDYMTKQLQMARLGQSSRQEKVQLEKEVFAFIDELRKNPRKALSNPNIGVDLKKFAAEILEEEIVNSQKSPDQLKIEEYESKLKQIQEERDERENQIRQKEYELLVNQEYERYDNLMDSAISKSDLPKSPYVIKKMTDYMIMGLENGLEVTPDDVLPLVREEIMNDVKEMFGAMPVEVMEQIIGSDNLNKLRKNRLSAARKPVGGLKQIPDVGKTEGKAEASEGKKLTIKEMFGI